MKWNKRIVPPYERTFSSVHGCSVPDRDDFPAACAGVWANLGGRQAPSDEKLRGVGGAGGRLGTNLLRSMFAFRVRQLVCLG